MIKHRLELEEIEVDVSVTRETVVLLAQLTDFDYGYSEKNGKTVVWIGFGTQIIKRGHNKFQTPRYYRFYLHCCKD